MASPNTIPSEKLARLIGTAACPVLVDVRPLADLRADPRLVPGSSPRPWESVAEWAGALRGRSVVAICRDGQQHSHGAAAWLRSAGVDAEVLEGGTSDWAAAERPMVPVDKLRNRDRQGRTVWVTRSRPKVDRIACPWLIRRFVDPERGLPVRAPGRGRRRRGPLRRRALRHRWSRRVLEPSRRALHLRCHGGRARPGHRTAPSPRHPGPGRRHQPARPRPRGRGAARGLPRPVADPMRTTWNSSMPACSSTTRSIAGAGMP